MSNPGSPWIRLRWWLANRLLPQPDPGESWCIQCTMNGGRTKILAADGGDDHAREHAESHPDGVPETIDIVTAWPSREAMGDADGT